MAYPESMLVPGSRWFHAGSDGHYTVSMVATCSTNGDREGVERSVVYWSDLHGQPRYREIGEFLDGRFVPEPVATATGD